MLGCVRRQFVCVQKQSCGEDGVIDGGADEVDGERVWFDDEHYLIDDEDNIMEDLRKQTACDDILFDGRRHSTCGEHLVIEDRRM